MADAFGCLRRSGECQSAWDESDQIRCLVDLGRLMRQKLLTDISAPLALEPAPSGALA